MSRLSLSRSAAVTLGLLALLATFLVPGAVSPAAAYGAPDPLPTCSPEKNVLPFWSDRMCKRTSTLGTVETATEVVGIGGVVKVHGTMPKTGHCGRNTGIPTGPFPCVQGFGFKLVPFSGSGWTTQELRCDPVVSFTYERTQCFKIVAFGSKPRSGWIQVQSLMQNYVAAGGVRKDIYIEDLVWFDAGDGPPATPSCEVTAQYGPGGSELTFSGEVKVEDGGGYFQQWTFSDGTTSLASSVAKTATRPGPFQGTFRIYRNDGTLDESATCTADVEGNTLGFSLKAGDGTPFSLVKDQTFDVTARVSVTKDKIGGFTGIAFEGEPLVFDPAAIEVVSAPTIPASFGLSPGDEARELTWRLKPLKTEKTTLSSALVGTDALNKAVHLTAGTAVGDVKESTLSMALATDVDEATKVGDDVKVTATLTNTETDPARKITGIEAGSLVVDPAEIATLVSGPRTETGTDPRVDPVSLGAGESTTLTWVYKGTAKGSAKLRGSALGRDADGDLISAQADTTFAIEAPAIDVTELVLTPGVPAPGQFANLRGTIKNTGSLDIKGIDFTLKTKPGGQVVDSLLKKLDPSASPRISTLEPGEERDFVIPFHLATDAAGLATAAFDLTMKGKATIAGKDSEIATDERLVVPFDLTTYWSSILADVKALLLGQSWRVLDGINEWGDSGKLGGISVGSSEGVLKAFQKMGDGILKVNDLLGEASGDGGERLTTQGEAMVSAIREYYNTTTPKQMAIDFANVRDNLTVQGVGVFADWMHDVDKAYTSGNTREVATLLAEPATDIAIGFGVEKAGGQLFAKLIPEGLVRDTIAALKRSPLDEAEEVPFDLIREKELTQLRDMATGVRIDGSTVARAGLTADEHAWMIETAKKHGVAFFVRPRPEDAVKWAKLGYNAKPVAIKNKSLNALDIEWLGYDDFAGKEGLVVLREPKDPFEALQKAVDRGDVEYGSTVIDEVLARYNVRKAEWLSAEDMLKKLNAGERLRDQALRQDHQDQGGPRQQRPDALQPQRPAGLQRHRPAADRLPQRQGDPALPAPRALAEAGFGLDSQHGDSVATSDFDNWEQAKKFAGTYANEAQSAAATRSSSSRATARRSATSRTSPSPTAPSRVGLRPLRQDHRHVRRGWALMPSPRVLGAAGAGRRPAARRRGRPARVGG